MLELVKIKENTDGRTQKCLEWKKDPFLFTKECLSLSHPVKGTIPFELYDWQRKALEKFLITDKGKWSFVTARQVGKTSLIIAAAVNATCFECAQIGIVSFNLEYSKLILAKIKSLINRLPEELIKVLRLEIVRDTAKVIEFANGARIRALPATCMALRGESFDYVFVDEAAHINSGELEGLLSQADCCSQKLIVLSTPTRKKENNKVFKSFCENSEKTNVKWNDVPGRDSKWVEEQIAHLDYHAAAAEYFLQM